MRLNLTPGISVAEDLIVKQVDPAATGTLSGLEASVGWVLRDSVVSAVDTDGHGLRFIHSGGGTFTVRNVTAIDPGANAVGVEARKFCAFSCSDPASPTLDAKNLIARGGIADLRATSNTATTIPPRSTSRSRTSAPPWP